MSIVSNPPRVVELAHIHNFRDLGGYRTASGHVTRWRTMYRADGIYRLSGPDLDAVRALGLRTVVDLRTEGELEARGRFPVEEHPVGYHHLSIMDVIWPAEEAPAAGFAEFLLGRYLDMLSTGEDRVAGVFHVLAVPGAMPAVFHCAAGKDRTGIIAALLLASMGVPDDVVVADYALTAEAMERMRAWASAHDPESVKLLAEVPAAHLAAEPAAIQGLLVALRQRHGSIRKYLSTIGVGTAVLGAIAAAFLEPADG